MPVNPATQDMKFYEALYQGFRVERAAATLPASTTEDLFSIDGGRVLLTGIVGEVTTLIQTQADNTKLTFDPDNGGTDQDLCAVLDITADPVGELYTITGVVANALRSDFAIGQGMTNPLVLMEGDIKLDCSATNTGAIAWTLWYIPLDDGAVVTAV